MPVATSTYTAQDVVGILDTARALLAEATSAQEAAETLLASAMEVTQRRAGLLGLFDADDQLQTLARNRMEVPIDVLLQEHGRTEPHLLPDGKTEDPTASCLVTPVGPRSDGILMLEDPLPGAPPPRDALAVAHALAGLLWSRMAEQEHGGAAGRTALLASPRLISHRRKLDIAAREIGGVFLAGEIGTEKEELARWFHGCTPAAERPFATLRVASFAADEHTILHTTVDAAVARAAGGTLFIDSPELLPPELQDQLAERITERAELRRLVCGSTRALAELEEEGNLRPGLVRLLGTRLNIPPLRGHPEDVVSLVDVILRELPSSPAGPRASVTDRALNRLSDHAWPGNVDELRAVLGMAACRAGRGPIAPRHLPVEIRQTSQRATLRTLAEVEREHIARVLAAVRTKREAAQVLGIAPSTLYEKLRRHRLSP